MAISPTNASRCWRKDDLGAFWAGGWVVREVIVVEEGKCELGRWGRGGGVMGGYMMDGEGMAVFVPRPQPRVWCDCLTNDSCSRLTAHCTA